MADSKKESKKIILTKQGIVSLEEDYELSMLHPLLLPSSDGLKIEIKYPNYRKFLESNKAREAKSFERYLKTVHLRVKPVDNALALNKAFDGLNLCESLLGIYPNLAFDASSNENKVIVQGFRSRRMAYKNGQQLDIGDLLISINDIEVNSDNIEILLSAIRHTQTIKIIALSPVTYLNLDTDQIVFKKMDDEFKLKRNATKKILAPSKSTQVVQGDRVKCADHLAQDDTFYAVMILSLDRDVNKPSNNNEKVLYLTLPPELF